MKPIGMKHIGILAHSSEGSALCYLAACHEGSRRLGPHHHPDVTMSFVALGASLAAWESGDLAPIRAILAETVRRLKAAGADFFVCPANTAHIALEAAGEPLALPGLHIAETVADEAIARGFGRIGVLGTEWTMEGPVYRGVFGRRGLDLLLPPPADRGLAHRIIIDELCNGVFTDASRAEYVRIIADLGGQGCDAVVLACTEIPLLITPQISPLPTLDSTRLLAAAAVEVALGERPFPIWRGGRLDPSEAGASEQARPPALHPSPTERAE
jgi:aspartate racemase